MERFWEIDSLRGIALLGMLLSNLITDLAYFNFLDINISSGFWWWFARIVAGTFIFLVGVSLTLSYSKAKQKISEKQLLLKYIKRGLKIFSWGLAITLVTWIFIPQDFVVFGVLHLIGVAIILSYPFLNKKLPNLIYGIFIFLFGLWLSNFTFDFNLLLWLGFIPANFHTVDYFPLLPWFGVILLGIYSGNRFYENYKRTFAVPKWKNSLSVKGLSFLGKHSLKIYLIHQPIILIILFFLF
ncbi:MAG: heparan-alpha-glucosaminide N-acetyltransferase [Candidatus Diapherotrites archaeon]